MIKKLTFSFFIFSVFVQPLFAQISGGPDAFGYTWLHSNALGGPVYNWVDIIPPNGGTQIHGLEDDNSAGWIPIGFDFTYYWNDYDKVRVGSNGWVSFSNISNIAHGFPNIPTPGGAGDNFLAPFLTDLNFSSEGNSGQAFYWSNNVDSFIVTYYQVPFWANSVPDYTGSNTFQVILNGADNSITFQYQEQSGFGPNTALVDVVYGIENVTGTIGLECIADAYFIAPAAIQFTYPSSVSLEIPDLEPVWNQNNQNEGSFFFKGSAVSLVTNVSNVGNATVDPPTTAIASFVNSAQVTSYSSQRNLGSIAPGGDTTVGFADILSMPIKGDFKYRVSVSNNSDINLTNNNNDVEFVVVDSVNGEVALSFFTPDSTPTGVVMWQGGGNNSGAGLHVKSPYYPATVKAIEVFVTAGDIFNPTAPLNDGCRVNVRDIIPSTGDPGNELTGITVGASALTPNQWNRIDFPTPAVVTEDFYVQWLMGGDSIALGTDNRSPYSRRSYEILDGGWAKYRLAEAEDLAIRVVLDAEGAGVDTSALGINTPVLTESDIYLGQSYPNPANEGATIEFHLGMATDAVLSLYDNSGKLINRFEYTNADRGSYKVNVNTNKLAGGMYTYTLTTMEKVLSKKIMVVR